MRLIILLLIVVVAGSCNPKTYVYIDNELIFGALSNGLPDRDSMITLSYVDGSRKSAGKYAVTNNGLLSELKVGIWGDYYENGQLKSEGNYKISSYLNCCIGGPCREYYSFKDGLWKYFNEKGDLIYEVEFFPSRLYVHTNCEGGDSLLFGLIKTIPLKYLESLTPDIIFDLQKVKVDDDTGSLTYTPLNGKLHVRYEVKR